MSKTWHIYNQASSVECYSCDVNIFIDKIFVFTKTPDIVEWGGVKTTSKYFYTVH